MRILLIFLITISLGYINDLNGQNVSWTRFRGADCSGISDSYSLPDSLSPETNVLWKIKVPPGNSSPVISGDSIFLTASLDETLLTICINRKDGKVLWQREVKPEKLEKPNRLAGLASPTPTTDGDKVYVYFGSFGLLCYDFYGNEIWKKPLPPPNTQHGTGTSPVLCEDKLILLCDQDTDSYLLAVNKTDGRKIWETKRPFARRGFSTPLIISENGEPIIITPGTLRVVAYCAKNGAEKWSVSGLPNEVCPSPIFADGLIFCCGWTPWAGNTKLPQFSLLIQQLDKDNDGKISQNEAQSNPIKVHFLYADSNKDGTVTQSEWEEVRKILSNSENSILAIQPGGTNDVTHTHIKWKNTRGLPYVSTPLYYRGKIWLIKNGGLLTCYDAKTGQSIIQEERIGAGVDYYASPIGGDGKIYLCSQQGVVIVIVASDSLQILSRSSFNEQIMATPAICDGNIYLRTISSLFGFKKMY